MDKVKKAQIKHIVKQALKDFNYDGRDQSAKQSFEQINRFVEDMFHNFSDGITQGSVIQGNVIYTQLLDVAAKSMQSYSPTSIAHDVFENVINLFKPFHDYVHDYVTDPNRYQNRIENLYKKTLNTLEKDVKEQEEGLDEYIKMQTPPAGDSGEKSFVFRGKAMTLASVKSEMTQEIANAFSTYEDKNVVITGKKKEPIREGLGRLMDSVSVDPSTGEVELEMSNILPSVDIGGAPFPLEEEDEYDGIPVTEWDDPKTIQKWIDENLGKLIIVKTVKKGNSSNVIYGVWNGEVPMGMNIRGKTILRRIVKNMVIARTQKALNIRIRHIAYRASKNLKR